MDMEKLSGARKLYDKTLRCLLYLCAFLTCALLVFMIGYIFYRGLPHVTWNLISTKPSYLSDNIGILPDILNTLYIVIATLVIVLPLGVGAAIYLTEYARNRKLVTVIEFATETLTGIPSIPPAGQKSAGGRAYAGHHDPAHHRAYHPGIPENRARLLSGGGAGPGERKVAYDPYHRAALLH